MNTNQLLALLCELLLKSALILLAASLIHRAWTRASAAQRHLVWCAALTAILLLPLTRLVAPRWEVPIVRVSAALPERVNLPEPTVVEITPVAQTPAAPIEVPRWQWPDWRVVVASIWAVGAAGLLAVRLFGSGRLLWLRISSPRIEDPRLSVLADEVFREVGVRRRVALRLSSTGCVPLTWGTLLPVLMLPAEALHWSDARIIAALRHEAGHIVRGDHFTRWLAHLACALYWPNPLVWLAARRLRTEQEQATDDLVLRAGTPADEYAAQLFEVARTLAARRGLAQCAVAMASPSTLEQRMLAIVDERRDRRPLSLRAVVGGVAAVLLVLGLATAAQVQAQAPAPAPNNGSLGATSPPANEVLVGGNRVLIEARFMEFSGEAKGLPDFLQSSKSEAAPGIRAVQNEAQLQALLRAISATKGVDLLSSPRVVTTSGSEAKIEIIREFRYPTAFQKNSKTNEWEPSTFDTKNIGISFEVTPEVKADGTIALRMMPEATEFEGYVDLDAPKSEIPTGRDLVGPDARKFPAGHRKQPIFSTRKINAEVTVKPGETVVLGGLNREDVQNVEDRVPVLADLPVVGGAFKSNAQRRIQRRLFVLVTARVGQDASVPAGEAEKAKPAESSQAMTRARKIVLPRVEFRDTTVSEALEFFRQKARELDEEKQGVNLVFRRGAEPEPKITLSLTNVPLAEALRYLATLASLELADEGNAFIFAAPGAPKAAPAPEVPASKAAAAESAPPVGPAFEKAKKIVIPRVELREATLTESLDFLRAKAIELDPDKKGVRVVLTPGPQTDARITLSLTEVPLFDALRYVAALAGLQLAVEPHALILRPPAAAPSASKPNASVTVPIEVTSDRAILSPERNAADFTGDVKVKVGEHIITGDRIRIEKPAPSQPPRP